MLEGKASNGGFAIDQMTFNPGDCPSKIMMIFSRLIMIMADFYDGFEYFVKEEVLCYQ